MERRLFLSTLGFGTLGLATKKYWFLANPVEEVSTQVLIEHYSFELRQPLLLIPTGQWSRDVLRTFAGTRVLAGVPPALLPAGVIED